MENSTADRAFERFRTRANPQALACVFDATAAELLRVATDIWVTSNDMIHSANVGGTNRPVSW